MSNRTLIELNHDYAHEMGNTAFLDALGRYLRGGSREAAEALERFGCTVISMRHHSGEFHIPPCTDGFPA